MIYAANLKCYHTRISFEYYVKTLNNFLKKPNNDIYIFPNSSAFYNDECLFLQGAQNFYPCKNGAYTGELGKDHLDEFDIKSVLIGHSERRMLGDDENLIEKKFYFAKNNNFNIIFCVGENLECKNLKKSKKFLENQIKNIDLNYQNLIIAYEPIYSIGTGISANLDDIEANLSFLRQFTNARLLYGGSVNNDNIKKIIKLNNCDGVLIGSAALDVNNFITLIKEGYN